MSALTGSAADDIGSFPIAAYGPTYLHSSQSAQMSGKGLTTVCLPLIEVAGLAAESPRLLNEVIPMAAENDTAFYSRFLPFIVFKERRALQVDCGKYHVGAAFVRRQQLLAYR